MKSYLDGGSYGSISAVLVDGVYCIQKRVHDILLGLGNTEDVGKNQLEPLLKKFYFECELLSKMRHPNIVQFMGIHYYGVKDGNKLVSIIMEYLPSNMGKCIEVCNRNGDMIPLSIKLSVLNDIVSGLSHLHAKKIIHRDLSAANILLTSSMTAKIADLGMSKYTDGSSNKLTKAPGANYIMPPEALKGNKYSEKMDVYSYGIISLYLVNQKEPLPDRATVRDYHIHKEQFELGMRSVHIDQVMIINQFLGNIIIECLMDRPEMRPSSDGLATHIRMIFCQSKCNFLRDLAGFIKSSGEKIFVSLNTTILLCCSNSYINEQHRHLDTYI